MNTHKLKISLYHRYNIHVFIPRRNGRWAHKCLKCQHGAALIILILIIVLSISVFAINFVDPEASRLHLEQRTQESLSKAKEAIIAYAVTSYDLDPGDFARLPCPDAGIDVNSREGIQGPGCGSNLANSVGRLPWRMLGIGPLRDGSGECLWYAVSGYYKSFANFPLLNEDSPGQLILYESDGNTLITPNTPDNRLVAAVFAPGPALTGQMRDFNPNTVCGGDYEASDFLEAVGLANNSEFDGVSFGVDGIVRGNSGHVINDRIMTISRAEIWEAIRSRNYSNSVFAGTAPYPADIFSEFTYELANCILNYGLSRGGGDLRLPWAVPANAVPQVNWYYNDDNNYVDQTGTFGGRFPFSIPATSAVLGGADGLFIEGECTAFADLTQPPYNLSAHPTFPLYRNLWKNWKDHVFYAVAEARSPDSASPSLPCGASPNRCLTVNGAGDYAAIVMFAGPALPPSPPFTGQMRYFDPLNFVDDKALTYNYLDNPTGDHQTGNAAFLNAEDGSGNYEYDAGLNFNDILVCIAVNPVDPALLFIDSDCDPDTPE